MNIKTNKLNKQQSKTQVKPQNDDRLALRTNAKAGVSWKSEGGNLSECTIKWDGISFYCW